MGSLRRGDILAYLEGRLDPEHHQAIERGLREAPIIQEDLRELRNLQAMFKRIAEPGPKLEHGMAEAVMEKIKSCEISSKRNSSMLYQNEIPSSNNSVSEPATRCSQNSSNRDSCDQNPNKNRQTDRFSLFKLFSILVVGTFVAIEVIFLRANQPLLDDANVLYLCLTAILIVNLLYIDKTRDRWFNFGLMGTTVMLMFGLRTTVAVFFSENYTNRGIESDHYVQRYTPRPPVGNQERVAGNNLPVSSNQHRLKEGQSFEGTATSSLSSGYQLRQESGFVFAETAPLSTFSIDVDTASYTNVRRFLNQNMLPPQGAVRIEEMINYFSYSYPQPDNEDGIGLYTELTAAPWSPTNYLLRIGIKASSRTLDSIPPANFGFLIDVSGSMAEELPIVKAGLETLVEQLRQQDHVGIIAYAGTAGEVLPPVSGLDKQLLRKALRSLQAGGSTAGAAGLQLAYERVRANFVVGGNNRVILLTDGDFNVGPSTEGELISLIQQERDSGIFLTVVGVGGANFMDAKMEALADKGNGNFVYIDSIREAARALAAQFGGALFTVARDVKIQVEFNPSHVERYRLLGYESRRMANEDFNNNEADAGELGAGQTVTALYEIIPSDQVKELGSVDGLRYQPSPRGQERGYSFELANIKLRYKLADNWSSTKIEVPVNSGERRRFGEESSDSLFAAAVAEFGMILRGSEFHGSSSYGSVIALAEKARGENEHADRAEFRNLVSRARNLSHDSTPRPFTNGDF